MHGPDQNASAESGGAKYPAFSPYFPRSCCRCFWRWWTRPSWPPRCRPSRRRPARCERASWIVVAYLIAATIAAPIYGRLGRRLRPPPADVRGAGGVYRGLDPVRRGADHRTADARARVAGSRRRRPDDAVAGVDRGIDPAARARALPGLSRHGGDGRQFLRSGGRRLSHRAFRLAVDFSDQCADRAGRGRADLAAAAAQIGRAAPLARRSRRLDFVHRVRGNHAAGA